MSILFSQEDLLNAEYQEIDLIPVQLSRDDKKNQVVQQEEKVEPFSYFSTKTYELQNLQQKAYVESNIVRGISNAKLGLLMSEYNNKNKTFDKIQKEKKRYLNPDNFETIFVDEYANDSIEYQRQEYYRQFILNPQIEQEKDEREVVGLITTLDVEKEREMPEMQEIILEKKKMLKDFKKEVRQIYTETEKMTKKTQLSMTCKNMTLVKKLAPTIFNAFTAFFDDIFDLFINEVLTEEAYYLNMLEQKQLIGGADEGSENQDSGRQIHPVRKVRELVAESQIPAYMVNLINDLDDYAKEEDYYC